MEGMRRIELPSHAWKARIIAIILHPHIIHSRRIFHHESLCCSIVYCYRSTDQHLQILHSRQLDTVRTFVAAPPGFEPRITESESVVLPVTLWGNMVI